MPNHDGTGPNGDCCKNKENRGHCGCGNEHRHRHGAEGHCHSTGETCAESAKRSGNGHGCCNDKKIEPSDKEHMESD